METIEGTVPTVNSTPLEPSITKVVVEDGQPVAVVPDDIANKAIAALWAAQIAESPAVQEGLTNQGLQLNYEAISKALKSDSFESTSLLQPIAAQAFGDGSPVEEPRIACADHDCTAHEYFGADEELPVVGDVTREEFEELRDAVATLARALTAILADLTILDDLEARIALFNKNSAHKL